MRLTKTLRSVAGFEALKGALVLLAGFDLLAFMGRDLARFINQVVTHFHLNPANRLPRIFLDAYENITDSHRVLLAAFALAYASVRFVEAYGLWWGRRWAEWFAALSAGIYLPFELY